METKTLTIPFILENVTEREMEEQIAPQIMGKIISIDMVPACKPIRGHHYSNAVIEYKPFSNIRPQPKVSSYGAEWTKSRNFP